MISPGCPSKCPGSARFLFCPKEQHDIGNGQWLFRTRAWSPDDRLRRPMSNPGCFLCAKDIPTAPGSSLVEVMLEGESEKRFFHLPCFVAFTTGTPPDANIWTYRIVANPTP